MARNRANALIIVLTLSLISIQGVVEVPFGRIKDVLLTALLGGPRANPSIGRIKTVSGTASISRGSEHLPATLGASVYQADVIETGADGSIGITFVDDSVFSSGPDSQFALSAFQFDSNNSHGNMLAELKKGTLAVVSGEITHTTPGAMRIQTPTSILGVRGTTFAVEVAGTGLADQGSIPVRCLPNADAGSDPAACAPGERQSGERQPGERQPEERYVVLPNADGRPGSGAITVSRGSAATTLDQPYAAAELHEGEATSVTLDAAQTDAIFRQALAARPMLPAHFRLNFLLDSDQMTPESAAAYGSVVEDIKKRQTYEVELIGYTDALADEAHNKRLSVSRAAAIRRALIKDGVDPQAIAAEGRGETELLIPTAHGVAEPRNRRVEITVR